MRAKIDDRIAIKTIIEEKMIVDLASSIIQDKEESEIHD